MIKEKLEKALEISDKIGTSELSELLVEIINEQKHNDFVLENYLDLDVNGMFLVGVDIPPGMYQLFPCNSDDYCYVETYRDAKFNGKSKKMYEEVCGKMYIEIENGIYLKLRKCYIKEVKIETQDNAISENIDVSLEEISNNYG